MNDFATQFWSLPNLLTSSRLVIAIVLFGTIALGQWLLSLALFCVAAFTDWLDGYLARRQGLVSSLGRVYDPLVDKVLVSGAFIFLMEARGTGLPGDAGLRAWMVTLVVAREFIVAGLRSFFEQAGVAFGADWFGKLKMILQCACIAWILLAFSNVDRWSDRHALLVKVRDLLVAGMLLATAISGGNYLLKALAIVRRSSRSKT